MLQNKQQDHRHSVIQSYLYVQTYQHCRSHHTQIYLRRVSLELRYRQISMSYGNAETYTLKPRLYDRGVVKQTPVIVTCSIRAPLGANPPATSAWEVTAMIQQHKKMCGVQGMSNCLPGTLQQVLLMSCLLMCSLDYSM